MGSQKRRALHVNYRIAQTHPISKRDNGPTVEPEFNGDDLRNVDLKVFGVSVTLNMLLRSVHPKAATRTLRQIGVGTCSAFGCLAGDQSPCCVVASLSGRPDSPSPRRKRELAHSALGT
jgi:hypothetical protein